MFRCVRGVLFLTVPFHSPWYGVGDWISPFWVPLKSPRTAILPTGSFPAVFHPVTAGQSNEIITASNLACLQNLATFPALSQTN